MFNPKWKHAIAFYAVLVVDVGRGLAAQRSQSYSKSKLTLPDSLGGPVAHCDSLKRHQLHQFTTGNFIHRRSRLGIINSPLCWVGILRGGGAGLTHKSQLGMKSARPQKGASTMVLLSVLFDNINPLDTHWYSTEGPPQTPRRGLVTASATAFGWIITAAKVATDKLHSALKH